MRPIQAIQELLAKIKSEGGNPDTILYHPNTTAAIVEDLNNLNNFWDLPTVTEATLDRVTFMGMSFKKEVYLPEDSIYLVDMKLMCQSNLEKLVDPLPFD